MLANVPLKQYQHCPVFIGPAAGRAGTGTIMVAGGGWHGVKRRVMLSRARFGIPILRRTSSAPWRAPPRAGKLSLAPCTPALSPRRCAPLPSVEQAGRNATSDAASTVWMIGNSPTDARAPSKLEPWRTEGELHSPGRGQSRILVDVRRSFGGCRLRVSTTAARACNGL